MDDAGDAAPRRILEGVGTLRSDSKRIAMIHYRIPGEATGQPKGTAILVAGTVPGYQQRLMLDLEDGTSRVIEIIAAVRRAIRFTILGE